MSRVSLRKAHYLARYNAAVARLAILDAAFEAGADAGGLYSYTFDSGEGRQSAKMATQNEMLKMIDLLERQIEWLINKLYGQGIAYMTLRRK